MHRIYKYCRLLFLFCIATLTIAVAHAQDKELTLIQKIEQNNKLYQVNIDKAFEQLDGLVNDAVIAGDSLSELVLLDRVCRYYYSKNDVNNLIDSSDRLKNKSVTYKNSNYEAMSHVYMAEAYSINLLTKNALKELDKAMYILDANQEPNAKTFYTKSNVLISQANIYNDQKNYGKAVQKIKLAVKSFPGEKGSESYNSFQYVNYSNLGGIYVNLNIDSAAYYALKSVKLSPKEQGDDKIMSLNYYVLGKGHLAHKRTDEALQYFLKSDKITKENGESSNIADLYQNIISIYSGRGDSLKVKEYKDKLQEYELFVLKSKYNSLQKVISKEIDEKPDDENNLLFLLCGATALIILMLIAVIIYRRRRTLKQNEPKDDVINNKEYELLLEMIKKDDSSFIYTFEKIYPDFSKKLLSACPQLVQTEIEFCALLKMKLSTKQIAHLTFIETRTVQNKKHRIRKKLNLPADRDIYQWFDTL